MKKILVLLLVLCAFTALAENKVIYTLDFEDYPAGSVFGYDGWEKFYGTQIDAVVDSEAAHSGNVYLFTDGANSYKNDIDISESYEQGASVLVKFFVNIPSTSNERKFYVKLHNRGTIEQKYNNEIAEFQVGKTSFYIDTGSGHKTGSGNFEDVWTECGIVFNPGSRSITRLYVGENDYDLKDDPWAYKTNTEGSNDLIDGIRLMGDWGAGCQGCLDDLTIELVPEPAFLGLLALLGLFFVRKER